MSWIDYGFIIAMMALLVWGVLKSRAHMQGVSDFLAAGRTAGRYTICVSQGIAALGAISIVASFEMYLQSGFSMQWWELLMAVVVLFVTVSGWVVYRFRQTRALTMAQFFEMRYSRRFRIFAGIIAWLSGIVNYGIYPAVSARFFIYFCGLPHSFDLFGVDVSTFILLMISLLGTAIFFVFMGGQIAIILTDFIQGIFVSSVFVVIAVLFLLNFSYDTIFESLSQRPENSSFLNPFKTGEMEDFNFWFFLIGVVIFAYNMFSWQGTQGYNASASSAHEARMGQVLTNWRQIPQMMFLLLVGVCAYTVMNHPDYAAQAESIREVISLETNVNVQSQLTVPVVLSRFLPIGVLGAFAAVMLSAFITTNDTYLHSWGSILVQDVIMPLRKKPFTPGQHIRVLRWSILFVAVFAFCFSLCFQQTEYIFLFFAITGAIFAGGAGSVIIGGLYWKRGTTAAAWGAMITGSLLSVGGIICQQWWGDWFGKEISFTESWGAVTAGSVSGVPWIFGQLNREILFKPEFPINGMVFTFIAIASSVSIYVILSLSSRKQEFDMDRLLHRGKYAVEADRQDRSDAGIADLSDEREPETVRARMAKGIKILFGQGKEFTRRDKWICRVTYAWVFAWLAVFLFGTIWNLTCDVTDAAWMKYWYIFVVVRVVAAVFIIVWFAIGGVADIRKMFDRLRTMKRDHVDDGSVN